MLRGGGGKIADRGSGKIATGGGGKIADSTQVYLSEKISNITTFECGVFLLKKYLKKY